MDLTPFKLTLEQQFAMQRMQQEMRQISHEQATDLLLQASRLLMLKNNIIKSLVKQMSLQPLSFKED